MGLRELIWRVCVVGVAVFAVSLAGAQTPANPLSYSRTVSYTFDPVTGQLVTETVEPDAANIALCLVTTYARDAYGNVNGITQSNCAGTVPARQQIATRTNSLKFAPASPVSVTVNGTSVTLPQGMFAQELQNALTRKTTQQFDPRFGVLTQSVDPNNLTLSWQVDDFGRKTRETRPDGTSTVFYHCILSSAGLDTSSNSASCPTPSASEIPADAVQFVHAEPRNTSGAKMGPYTRAYTDRFGRAVRTATEAFDGSAQPAGPGGIVVADTDFNAYGAKVVTTAPYFLSTASTTTTGASDYGMTLTTFDALGRIVEVDTADTKGSLGNIAFGGRGSRIAAKIAFSFNGLTVTQTNDKNQAQTQEKDILGQTVRVTDALGAQLVRQFDAFGNLIKTKDALQNLVAMQFDYRGRRTQLNDPDTGLRKFDYTPLGEVVWQQTPKQNAAGQQTTFTYDVLSRQTGRVDPEYATSWSYDAYANGSSCPRGIGQVCEITVTNFLSRKFAFDAYGRPANARTTVTNGPSFASTIAYNPTTGAVASKTYPTGLTVNQLYTAKGFLEKLTLAQSGSVSPLPATPGGAAGTTAPLSAGSLLWQAKAANAAGRMEQEATGNGVNTASAFEADSGRLRSIAAGVGSTTTAVDYTYTWDSLGNLATRSDANGDGTRKAVTESFGYDDLNRLNQYAVTAPAIPGFSRQVTLQYNALGSLLFKSDVGVYAYNANGNNGAGQNYARPHALQSISGSSGTTTYQYDDDGNLTGASSGKYQSITYTSFGLPDASSGIRAPGGSPSYVWSYDENHGRFKELRTVVGGTYAGARTTWYLHPDQSGGLAFESEVNSPTSASASNPAVTSNRHYLTAGGSHVGVLVSTGALSTLAASDMAPPALPTASLVKIEYWHVDHLGSPVATTDHTGAVTARYAYDPFGKRRFPNGQYDANGVVVGDWSPAVNNGMDRGYTGHEHLDDIGLIHMNGRLYDPTMARMLQADPVVQSPENLQNYNRYTYCFNNPSTCTDPTGFVGEAERLGAEDATRDQIRSRDCAEGKSSCSPPASSNANKGRAADQPGGDEKRSGAGAVAAKGVTVSDVASNLWNSGDNWIGLTRNLVTSSGTTAWNVLNFLGAGVAGDSQWAADSVDALLNRDRGATISTAMVLAGGRVGARVNGESTIPAGGALKVNPTGSMQNCTNCVAVVDNLLSTGSPASALPRSTPMPFNQLPSFFKTTFSGWTSRAALESTLLKAGNGTRAVVYGTDGATAHVWNAVVQRGRVNYIDGQMGSGGTANFQAFPKIQFGILP